MATLLLDAAAWDLALDASGNVAVAGDPYALAQDAASACRTFRGECYWDTSIGVPYLWQVFGGARPSLAALKAMLVGEVLGTVAGASAAQCFVAASSSRSISGQVQVVGRAGGAATAASFTVVNPQGEG